MKVTKCSRLTGKWNTREIDVTESEIQEIEDPGGRCVQYIVPHLSPSDREFLITGITKEEWDELILDEEY